MGVAERHNACKYLTIQIGNVFGAMGLVGNIVNESGVNFIPNRMEISWKKRTGWNDGWENGVYNKALDTITPAINNGTYRNYRIDGDGTRRLVNINNDNCRDAFTYDYIGYGLTQTTFWSRKRDLYDFATAWCKQRGIQFDISNFEMQLDFIIHELFNSYKSTLATLMTSKDIKECAKMVCVNFEKPQGYNTYEVQNKRYMSAVQIYAEVFASKPTQWFKYLMNWYYMQDGIVYKDKWVQDNGNWYHLDSNGKMETSAWVQYNGIYYYVNAEGKMLINQWVDYKGKWYYMQADGAMAKDTKLTIENKEYSFDIDGVATEV